MASTPLLPNNGGSLLFTRSSSFPNHNPSATLLRWGWRCHPDANTVAYRTRGQAFQVLANPNVSPGKGRSNNEVIMVDPLEAKRLAAKQMAKIKAKEKFKRRRQIEAINGAWAMIGLTAGLVIEGQTGKNILTQLADYWGAIVHFFVH
ncbi:Chlorophyll A-B binding protein [Trema orientale]|uniref:Chlorophyll A-B binding protein n=1 Tax=Trema orientale TaxID=63057 RepID=A0A2P5FZX5_TREOI|nr:Chlorophyll A-B binding protein [Trema orientale]